MCIRDRFRVEHDQCQLTFYLPGEAGELPNSFKVYYVSGGQEMDACETACTRRDPLGHMAVSYTHLDVYKRQVQAVFDVSDYSGKATVDANYAELWAALELSLIHI